MRSTRNRTFLYAVYLTESFQYAVYLESFIKSSTHFPTHMLYQSTIVLCDLPVRVFTVDTGKSMTKKRASSKISVNFSLAVRPAVDTDIMKKITYYSFVRTELSGILFYDNEIRAEMRRLDHA